MAIQLSYEINPEIGFVGDLARPNEPHSLDSGVLVVPAAATRMPRPGDALYYDTANDGFAIPTTAARRCMATVGILHYRRDAVVESGATVAFGDGAEIEVAVFGTFWVSASAAMEYGQRIHWDTATFDWSPKTTPNSVANLGRLAIVCVSRHAVGVGGIAQARIGYGRIL